MITEIRIKAALRAAPLKPGKRIELKDAGERGAGRFERALRS
jgi:hypothetical protein